jgi:hypothetical protein
MPWFQEVQSTNLVRPFPKRLIDCERRGLPFSCRPQSPRKVPKPGLGATSRPNGPSGASNSRAPSLPLQRFSLGRGCAITIGPWNVPGTRWPLRFARRGTRRLSLLRRRIRDMILGRWVSTALRSRMTKTRIRLRSSSVCRPSSIRLRREMMFRGTVRSAGSASSRDAAS